MEIVRWCPCVCVPAACQVTDCRFVIVALSGNDVLHTYNVTDVENSKGRGEGGERSECFSEGAV